jgi:DNA-binding transcriptional ArsR family regulator
LPDKPDDSITKVYSALGNPYRRQIVQILKEEGKAGFKELHEALKISVGALYHHLDTLGELVTQDAEKKYVLTDKGRTAINALSVSEEKMTATAPLPLTMDSKIQSLSRELLFGRSLFSYLNDEPLRSLPLSIIILVLGGWVSFQTNLEPLLLFYLNPSPNIGKAWFLLMFALGWFVTFALTDGLSSLIYNRTGGDLSLANGTAFSMLPLLIIPVLLSLVQPFSIVLRSTAGLIVLQILIQVWVICLLASAASISKGLRMERTALISLAVMYLNITAILLTLQLGLF